MRLADLKLLNTTNLPKTDDNVIKTVLTEAFILLGAISLLMIE
jgi:hypothetical protein